MFWLCVSLLDFVCGFDFVLVWLCVGWFLGWLIFVLVGLCVGLFECWFVSVICMIACWVVGLCVGLLDCLLDCVLVCRIVCWFVGLYVGLSDCVLVCWIVCWFVSFIYCLSTCAWVRIHLPRLQDSRWLGRGAGESVGRQKLWIRGKRSDQERVGGILRSLVRTLQTVGAHLGPTRREVPRSRRHRHRQDGFHR